MRVLHVLDMLDINSGITNIIINYFRYTDRTKIECDFLVPSGYIQYELRKEIEDRGGKVFEFKAFSIKNYNSCRKIMKTFFQEHGAEYEIVQCSFFHISRIVFDYAQKYGIRIRIAHSHSSKLSDVWYKQLRNKLLLIGAFRKATNFVAVSEKAGVALFGTRVIAMDKLIIQKNAIQAEKYKFCERRRSEMRKQLDVEGKFVVCHIGNFNRIKNQTFILPIIKELLESRSDVVLLLVGDAGYMKEEIEHQSISLGISNSVRFLGERNDVNDILQASDIFIFPSLHEGFGLSLLEAQCSGLPCICSDTIPKEVFVTSNCFPMSLEEDAEVWAEKILQVSTDFFRDSKACTTVIEKGYDIVVAAREIENTYIDLIKECTL